MTFRRTPHSYDYVVPTYGTCRFCKASSVPHGDMVKYGTRHWAHPACLFKARGVEAIDALRTWQIAHLPVLSMMEAGASVEQVKAWSKRVEDDRASKEGK